MASVVLTGDTSGAGTITVPAVAGTFTATIGSATGTHYPFTAGTAVASTSGTAIDFTSIPSWVKRITVMIAGVSTSGTSTVQMQLGTSGGVITSGYVGNGDLIVFNGNAGVTAYTSGMAIERGNTTAASTRQGLATFVLVSSNQWVGTYVGSTSGTVGDAFGSTVVTLGGTLDRVRITTVNGTDTFDAGSINILYE